MDESVLSEGMARYATTESRGDTPQLATVTEQVSRLHEQLDRLSGSVDDLRSRIGLVLVPEQPSEVGAVRAEAARQPSELGSVLSGFGDRIENLRWSIQRMHERVDL